MLPAVVAHAVAVLALPSAQSVPAAPAAPAFRSPIAGEWQVDAAVVAASVGLHAAAWVADRQAGRPDCPCDARAVPGFDRWPIGRRDESAALASTVLQVGLVFGGPALVGLSDPGPWDERMQALALALEASTISSGAVQLLKATTQRPRPPGYTGEPYRLAYHSFPSGHAASSFAAVTAAWRIWRYKHPGSRATPWIAIGGYATAATVAFLRVDAGRHFPSDVAAGAALGTGLALAVVEPRFRRGRIVVVPAPNGLGFAGRF